jgi:hypothetical protein
MYAAQAPAMSPHAGLPRLSQAASAFALLPFFPVPVQTASNAWGYDGGAAARGTFRVVFPSGGPGVGSGPVSDQVSRVRGFGDLDPDLDLDLDPDLI